MEKKKVKDRIFIVECSETLFYEIEVKAKNIDEARDEMYSGNVDFNYNDSVDSANFEISKVYRK